MGLDMYLTKKTHFYEEPKSDVNFGELFGAPHIQTSRISCIEEDVCYWRKSNQIHRWFVENCQDGVDDCKPHSVYIENIKSLLDVIVEILDEPSNSKRDQIAREKLPPMAGFFFGSYELYEGYYDDLKDTRKKLTELLKEFAQIDAGDFELFYRSSW
jgi:hypothetical protein